MTEKEREILIMAEEVRKANELMKSGEAKVKEAERLRDEAESNLRKAEDHLEEITVEHVKLCRKLGSIAGAP